MASLIDARLYLPEHWANEPGRCEKAVIPKETQCYQSKSALPLIMLKVALQRGIRFGYVGIDGGYGKSRIFFATLVALVAFLSRMSIRYERICWMNLFFYVLHGSNMTHKWVNLVHSICCRGFAVHQFSSIPTLVGAI